MYRICSILKCNIITWVKIRSNSKLRQIETVKEFVAYLADSVNRKIDQIRNNISTEEYRSTSLNGSGCSHYQGNTVTHKTQSELKGQSFWQIGDISWMPLAFRSIKQTQSGFGLLQFASQATKHGQREQCHCHSIVTEIFKPCVVS